MTEQGTGKKKMPDIDTSSASGIARLLLLFLWVLLKKSLRFLLKCIILFFFYIYKGIKWLISWWKDGDTRAKREILWKHIKKVGKKVGRWIVKGVVLFGVGLLWVLKKTIHGVLHLKTTLTRLCKYIGEWIKRMRQKDFKAIIRAKNESLKKSLTEFVTEDDKTTDEGAESEEELLREMNANKRGNNAFENAVERFTKYL